MHVHDEYRLFMSFDNLKFELSFSYNVLYRHYQIGRIRQFYMRKVKYTQQNCHDRLSQILDDFPKLDVRILLMLAVCRIFATKYNISSFDITGFNQFIELPLFLLGSSSVLCRSYEYSLRQKSL